MLFQSDRESSYHFPRLLIGFPWMFGITSPWTSSLNLPVVLPFWITSLLDFLGLKTFFAHVAIRSSSSRTHLACSWVGVITVRSSINALIAGCWHPAAVFGPLDFVLAAEMIRFIPMMNKMGEIVHPVTIPFSTGCHFVVYNRSLMSLR